MSEALPVTQVSPTHSERRAHPRRRPTSLTYVSIDKGNGGIVLDASEGGLSVRAVGSLVDSDQQQVRLKLAASDAWLEARVLWTRDARKVFGVAFKDLSEESRGRLREWLVRDRSAETGQPGGVAPAAPEERSSFGAAHDSSRRERSATHSAPTFLDHSDALVDALRQAASKPVAEQKPKPALRVLSAPPAEVRNRPDRIERAPRPPAGFAAPHATPRRSRRSPILLRVLVYAFVFFLSVGSLVAGWAVGSKELGPLFERTTKLFSQRVPESPTIAEPVETPSTPVSDIEVTNANKQQWTVSLEGTPVAPATELPKPLPTDTPAPKPERAFSFEPPALSAPARSSAASVAEAMGDNPAPMVIDHPGGPQIASVVPGGIAVAPPKPLPSAETHSSNLRRGALVRRVQPVYPEAARSQHISGTVVLTAEVGANGAIRGLSVISGPKLLVAAAEKAVRQWRYAPTLKDGKPIATQVRITLAFQLPSASQ